MIQRKQKICKTCKTKQFIWKKGNCLNCDKTLNKDSYEIKRSSSALSSPKPTKASQIKPKQLTKKKKLIAHISEAQKRRLVKYRINREQYFLKHPVCERCGSNKDRDLHHKKGKVGNLLYDQRFFMTACRSCHEYIHQNVEESYKMGWLVSSNDKYK